MIRSFYVSYLAQKAGALETVLSDTVADLRRDGDGTPVIDADGVGQLKTLIAERDEVVRSTIVFVLIQELERREPA